MGNYAQISGKLYEFHHNKLITAHDVEDGKSAEIEYS